MIEHAERVVFAADRRLWRMKATVAEKWRSRKARSSSASRSRTTPDYRPGAYFWVELPDRGHEDEKACAATSRWRHRRRSAALSGSRRDPGDRVQAHLAELRGRRRGGGEEPKGSFLLPEDTSAEYVFVAGGIGITVLPLDASLHRRRGDRRTASRSSTRTVTASRRRSWTCLEGLERRIEGLRWSRR